MLYRPEYHLDRLSDRFRWEATRRHPVYMQLWQICRTVEQSGDELSWGDVRRQPAILNGCLAVRIFGRPIDPAMEFDQLDEGACSEVVFRDSLQPLSVKQLAGVLAKMLSADALRNLAGVFRQLADGREERCKPEEAVEAASDLLFSDDPELSALLDAPFYCVSPVAPRERCQADLASVQAEWRERLELPARRERSSNYENYFRAWDLREGWSQGEYRREDVRTVAETASSLGESPTTVRNWYIRAFQLISGHECTPANWFALMGAQQLSELFGVTPSPTAVRRAARSPQPREIDVTTITRGSGNADSVTGRSPRSEDGGQNAETLMVAIYECMDRGSTDEEVLDELELRPTALDAVSFLRSRPDLRPADSD